MVVQVGGGGGGGGKVTKRIPICCYVLLFIKTKLYLFRLYLHYFDNSMFDPLSGTFNTFSWVWLLTQSARSEYYFNKYLYQDSTGDILTSGHRYIMYIG